MKPLFNKIKVNAPPHNVFDLSHEKKLSCKMGDLIPILCAETVPGDKFRVNTEVLARLAPMLAPVMHRVNLYTHFFFVPNRLINEKWETFITGGPQGTSVSDAPFVNMSAANKDYFKPGTLADYLGCPTFEDYTGTTQGINALPFRAYQLIYDEYYRDQTLQAAIGCSKAEGEVTGAEVAKLLSLRKRCWEKDYFTSALPWAQRGGDVLIPLGADVQYRDQALVYDQNGNDPAADLELGTGPAGQENEIMTRNRGTGVVVGNVMIDNIESIENGSYTINDLRRATKLQEWLEKNARAGARYIEQIFSHFKVKSSDARLQRPEYLGGSKQPIVISEVLSTYTQDGDAPQGNMAGHGVSASGNLGFQRFFEEHGFVIGILSILPRTAYQQGLPIMFRRMNKFEYYFPEFANIGEQEVYNGEVYFDPTDTENWNSRVFGYQSRYAEYKFMNSSVHGDFKTNMNYWHMGRIFENQPALNAAFVEANPTSRIFAVTDESVDKVYIQLYNQVKAKRPMPVFGTPTF